MTAPVDDGLSDLAAFCALLAATNEALEAQIQALQSQGDGFDDLEPDLREDVEAVKNAAEDLTDALETMGASALEVTDALGARADDARERASDIGEAALELAGIVDRALDQRAEPTASGFEELHGGAFAKLEAALQAAASTVDQWSRQLDLDLDTLGRELQRASDEVNRERQETTAVLEAAIEAVEEDERQVTSTGLDGVEVTFVLGVELPERIETRADEHRGTLATSFADWQRRSELVTTALRGVVGGLAEEATRALTTEEGRVMESVSAATTAVELMAVEVGQCAADLEGRQGQLGELSELRRDVETADTQVRRMTTLLDRLDPT